MAWKSSVWMENYKHFDIAKEIVRQRVLGIFGSGKPKPGYKGPVATLTSLDISM